MDTPSTTTTIAENEGQTKKTPLEHSLEDGGEAPTPMTPSMHDPNAPDLSFPFQSTNIAEGGFTDEYRVVSRTGFVPADRALLPIWSHQPELPPAVRDPEKARQLKDVKLVTFVPNDPQDPRNHPKWYKWCK